jgi:hypothetical protein
MGAKIKAWIVEGLRFFLIGVLPYGIGLCLLVAASFLIWGPFNVNALSERLIWTGIGCSLVGGILVMGQTTGGRDFGVPGAFLQSVHGQTVIDFNIEARKAIESKFGWIIRFFLMAAIVFAVGALINTFFVVK